MLGHRLLHLGQDRLVLRPCRPRSRVWYRSRIISVGSAGHLGLDPLQLVELVEDLAELAACSLAAGSLSKLRIVRRSCWSISVELLSSVAPAARSAARAATGRGPKSALGKIWAIISLLAQLAEPHLLVGQHRAEIDVLLLEDVPAARADRRLAS